MSDLALRRWLSEKLADSLQGLEVTYVRPADGLEMDFLARQPNGDVELIQVCADALNQETARRELRALEGASRIHPKARLRLLTLTQDGLPRDLPSGTLGQPTYEWMLERDGITH